MPKRHVSVSEFACLGANHLQTNHAEFDGTGRSSAARSPNWAAQDGSRRNRRHEPAELITQRSLVQIQPAQRKRRSQGVSERSGTPSCLQIVLNNPARIRRHRRRKAAVQRPDPAPNPPGAKPRAHPGARDETVRQEAFSALVARACKPFANAPARTVVGRRRSVSHHISTTTSRQPVSSSFSASRCPNRSCHAPLRRSSARRRNPSARSFWSITAKYEMLARTFGSRYASGRRQYAEQNPSSQS
jgi:hypothetical protein